MTEQTAITVSSTDPKDLSAYARSEAVMSRFQDVLGRSASAYVADVLLVVANSDNQSLRECTPISIITSALRAASLRLSCDQSTGQAYLVPFKDRNSGTTRATLIVGYKGLYHMAMRTDKYRFINVIEVFDGEEVVEDRMTGLHHFEGNKVSNKTIGWMLYFQLYNGFQKTVYMTVEEIHHHAQRYSKGYDRQNGLWKTDPRSMEKKTVLRLGLLHWGYFDPHDTMELNAIDEENQDVDLLPESVDGEISEPEPRKSTSELLGNLGFDEEPAKQKPAPVQPAPASPAPAGKMSLEMALTETNSEGEKYGDIATDKLSHMANAMQKKMRDNGITDEQHVEYQRKCDAIAVILANRNSGQ